MSPTSASTVCGLVPGAADKVSETSNASGSDRLAVSGLGVAVVCAPLRVPESGGATVTTRTIEPTSASTIRVIRRVITPYEVRQG